MPLKPLRVARIKAGTGLSALNLGKKLAPNREKHKVKPLKPLLDIHLGIPSPYFRAGSRKFGGMHIGFFNFDCAAIRRG